MDIKRYSINLIFIFIIFLLVGCNSKPLTRSNLALDTIVSITLYNNGSEEILDKCFEIINTYDQELDSYSEDSLINKFNETPTKVSPEIYYLLETNINYYNKTEGLFNPTLDNLIKLWDINEPEIKEPPTQEAIQKSLEHINPETIILSNGEVTLTDSQVKLNLGASSKGFIADQITNFLKEQNVSNALINLGGNITLVGDKNGEDFIVGIDNPDITESEAIATVRLNNKSIVTSGISQRYFTDSQGVKYHHILNPKTGYPENNDLKEVVIITDSSLEADILSTSLFLMGKDKAIEFSKDLDNTDIILITQNNKIYISPDLKNNFELTDKFSNSYQVEIINED